MSLYDKYVLPKFLNCACGSKPVEYQRKKVVPNAEGIVLEVGIGSGLNLPFYDNSKVTRIWGLDPSEELSFMAKETAKNLDLDVKFISSGAEEIPLPDNYFDNNSYENFQKIYVNKPKIIAPIETIIIDQSRPFHFICHQLPGVINYLNSMDLDQKRKIEIFLDIKSMFFKKRSM